ncbi:MAG: hypothetical protein V1933_03935 [Candidatus Omnitrophota bacterium]
MAKVFSLCVTILLLVFGYISLSGADSGSADNRDIVVDNAIGGMREGSRIITPDKYGKKTEIPKVPGAQLNPNMDTGVVAGAPAGGAPAAGTAAEAGNFPGGPSSDTLTGIETPPGTGTGGLDEGGTTPDSGGGSLIDIDANADLSSGSIDAGDGVSLDTSNTDNILDADLAAGDLTAGLELSSEITENAISSGTDIGTEVDTSGGTVGGEADVGVEADVTGGTESDATNDPADGLPAL